MGKGACGLVLRMTKVTVQVKDESISHTTIDSSTPTVELLTIFVIE